jgi:alpha-beta hydrolase superfamily lysophospholipase
LNELYTLASFIAQLPIFDICSGCWATSGLVGAWSSVGANFTSAINTARAAHPTYPVVFTGHSLGAALATVASVYYRKANPSVNVQLVSFLKSSNKNCPL